MSKQHLAEFKNNWRDRYTSLTRSVPAGEWDSEPDKVHWIDSESDLDCLLHRGGQGAWCGYVGVPAGHPAFQKAYDDVNVEVHGGLTYADFCSVAPDGKEHPEEGICHVPVGGRPHRVWWLGFDCNHGGDLAPASLRFDDLPSTFAGEVYRTRAYAERQVTILARQLASKRRIVKRAKS